MRDLPNGSNEEIQTKIDTVRENLVQLKGVGRKVADCICLFSMDCPGLIPVDTHVFQLAQKFGFLKTSAKQSSLNDKLHQQIGDAFRKVYGDHAGWAHQILFAGDLAQFKDKVAESKGKPKKRPIEDIT